MNDGINNNEDIIEEKLGNNEKKPDDNIEENTEMNADTVTDSEEAVENEDKLDASDIKIKNDSFFKSMIKRIAPIYGRIILLIAVILFASYAAVVIIDSEKYFEDFSKRSSQLSFNEDLSNADDLIRVYYDTLNGIARNVEFSESADDVSEALKDEYHIIWFANGEAYTKDGPFVKGMSGYDEIMELALSESAQESCSDIYYDSQSHIEYIAFFVPVRGSNYIDGLAYYIETQDILDLSKIRKDDAESMVLMGSDFKFVSESSVESFWGVPGDDMRNFLAKLTYGGDLLNAVSVQMQNGEEFSDIVKNGSESYTLSVSPLPSFGNKLWLVKLSSTSVLMSSDVEYIRHVINVCVISVVALVAVVLYLVFYYRKKVMYSEIKVLSETPDGCPAKEIFRVDVQRILQQHKDRKYAFTVFEIRQFRYLTTRVSETEMSNLLAYIAKAIRALCNARETYGYLGDGKFGLLIYVENDNTLKDRVHLVEAVASNNPLIGASKSKHKFFVGVSMTQEGINQTFQELLGYAEIACEKAKSNTNLPYVVSNEVMSNERSRTDKIEAEMENALETGEFKLFLQPKYNVADDRVDSAEALVRWFDVQRGDYRFPGEFIGLFEANGFIVKLDHFMYIEALKFLSSTAGKQNKVVPISVNVSIVTANDPDFLDFYIGNKLDYGVGDDFIVIEFTESFVMEDHQKIRTIVDTLHANGIRCSLDDFGSGYSSLEALKTIPFDEIKFDRFFLGQGYSQENDNTMLEAMYSLTKSMGIRVVQEGVETQEMFDRVVAAGGDAIQGYYYAKAIPHEEYKLFINSNTSIKYKSRVK